MNQLTRCDRLIQIRAPEFLTKALDNAGVQSWSSLLESTFGIAHFPFALSPSRARGTASFAANQASPEASKSSLLRKTYPS
jgi:hypothetical protein